MNAQKYWGLSTKLALIGVPFLILVLVLTAATLWVSWQLDGGAAAVNEAGRMRMQTYRMALGVGTGQTQELENQIKEFNASINLLRNGDADRPLFIPWDSSIQKEFTHVEQQWQVFHKNWLTTQGVDNDQLNTQTIAFASNINAFVKSIENHLVRWTAILHLLQMGVLVLSIIGAAILLFTGYLFVLEPVTQLKLAIEKIQKGDFGARVNRVTNDEFGTLAKGFNGMAAHVESMYQNLESKVREKTLELEQKRERLESLYDVTAIVTKATSLDELAHAFSERVRRIAQADGAAVRWADPSNQRFLMLAASGLPTEMVSAEQCLHLGDCHCGTPVGQEEIRIIPIYSADTAAKHQPPQALAHCAKAGFETVVNIPIRLQERILGEVSLFFNRRIQPSTAERSLYEALTSHLATAMENLHMHALEREEAISGERSLLARELHDSIAQSLAFLKIQVQLMRDALKSGSATTMQSVLEEIDAGVRESYGDVRELLLHFRTRTNDGDIEPALITTLQKFEHQAGIKTTLSMAGHGIPMTPDLQIQVLHIVQEALSNVRKHAKASHVWLDVQQQPIWRFEVRDNGIGFIVGDESIDETHVGLRIMQERALRLQAKLEVFSKQNEGSSVILTLPAMGSNA
ncbi:MAG TPA: type IV pili methyl-accepting chemotaxis transducer N-terminal domain-containing protein [Burkholderiaceae bacterium]|nr:type IV pili methyl-accepting chemotaxis transducer N-terminal domain-containing protein [Burkholderiaceae bacterium]